MYGEGLAGRRGGSEPADRRVSDRQMGECAGSTKGGECARAAMQTGLVERGQDWFTRGSATQAAGRIREKEQDGVMARKTHAASWLGDARARGLTRAGHYGWAWRRRVLARKRSGAPVSAPPRADAVCARAAARPARLTRP